MILLTTTVMTGAFKVAVAMLGFMALAGPPVLGGSDVRVTDDRTRQGRDGAAGTSVRVRVGQTLYRIPRGLLAVPVRGDGSDERAVLLRARLPELPLLSAVLIMVRDRARVDPLTVAFRLAAPDVDTATASTTHLDLCRAPAPGRHEAYVDAPDGTVVRYILCDPPDVCGHAACDHAFDHKAVRVLLSYGREHLHAWQVIERCVRRFLDLSETA